MQTEPLYLHRVDVLLAYLDGFKQRSEPFAEWQGGRQVDGSFRMPRPAYAPDVIAFFREVDQPYWQDPHFNARQAGNWLDHPHFINTAGYDRLRAMLTYCLRGRPVPRRSLGPHARLRQSDRGVAAFARAAQRTAPETPRPSAYSGADQSYTRRSGRLSVGTGCGSDQALTVGTLCAKFRFGQANCMLKDRQTLVDQHIWMTSDGIMRIAL